MITTITRVIDLSKVPYDKDEYEYEIPISELLEEIEIENIIEYHGKKELLEKMGYAEDLCFETDVDLKEAVQENSEAYGIELKEYFDGMDDNDIYDRFLNLLCDNKLTYHEWDEILSKYE